MPKITEFKFAGRDCKAAPPPFSDEACELVELFEESSAASQARADKVKSLIQSGKTEDEAKEIVANDNCLPHFRKNGLLLKLLRRVARGCLVRGGHTLEEAEDILLCVSMDDNNEDGIPALANALGVV